MRAAKLRFLLEKSARRKNGERANSRRNAAGRGDCAGLQGLGGAAARRCADLS
jgi:hypothetical protein